MPQNTVHVYDGFDYWERSGGTYVRGHAFSDGRLYRTADLASLFEETPVDEFERLLSELNGFYSVVRQAEDAVYLAVDHIQSYPLFYATTDDGAYVSNDAHWIKGQLTAPRVDPLLEFEFLLTGVVTGRDTLYPNIKQLQAGEYAIVDAADGDLSVSHSRYSTFENRPPLGSSEAELLDEFDAVLTRSFRRLVEVADGRQLAVSLSGGPDSRLIACMLRRLGYDDLVAFTFGEAGNWDSTVAMEVAKELAIPMEFVEYDHQMWNDWFQSAERTEYYRHAFNFDKLPSIGAVPAMGQMVRAGAIDDDAIVLCGNLVPSRYDYTKTFRRASPTTEADIAEYLLDRFYRYWEWDDDEVADAFRSRLESQLDIDAGDVETAAVAATKDWRIRNRNAKALVTPEEYGFWGIESWTPLWDEEIMRFWEQVPLQYRDEKRLHLTYVEQLYRDVTGGATPPGNLEPGGPLKRLESAIDGSPLDGIVRPIYERFEDTYKRRTRPSPYVQDPIATTGIMTQEQFEELYNSVEQDVHPFKAIEIVGCVSFDPPVNVSGPVDGRLDLDRLRTTEHVARRESLPWFDATARSDAGAERGRGRVRAAGD